eukprot:XP_003726869.1 PREDICTED: uncharacterized protein LOC100888898 isoform X2 [Strongylocentrotus purpuratus]
MEHGLSNSCDSNPSNGYSYSLSYVYNMDTGLVEAHPATSTETIMPAAGSFSSSSAASSREQAGGLVLPAGNGYHSEVTTLGSGGGGDGGRNGPESGQFDNSQEFNHQGSANLQSEISQNRSSSFTSSAQTTHPISLSVSIADNDNELYVNVGDEGRHDLNGNEFFEKVVETSLGKISYSHLPKHQEYRAVSLKYDMIEEENGPLNEYQFSTHHSYQDIVAATEILRYEEREHEANMISIIDAHKSLSSSMAPVPQFMNRPTSDAPPTNYGLSSTNLVVVDLPRRAEQCPENGEIIYVQVDDGSDVSSAKSARMPMATNESDKNGLLIPRLSARSDNETSVIDDGIDPAESRVTEEPFVDYSATEKNDITDENYGAKMDRDIVSKKGEFREPPRISRQLGMFGTDEHVDSQQKDSNDSPADSEVDFHSGVSLHSSTPTTSMDDSHRRRISSQHCQLIDGVSTTVVMSSTTTLSRSSGDCDHDQASRGVIPACSSLTAFGAPSTQPIKPVALSASLPLSHQLIAYGMTGVSSAVPPPIHPQPMLPIPLPPLAVFAHPIHLFPAPLPWHIHSHVSAGPVPQRTSGRYPTNCPHFIHSTTTTNTTTALNSTARLAASYPLLKRGRRPRRQPLTNIEPTPQETNPDETELPITKRTEANARERDRVTYLNGGFEQLRRVLPWAYRGGRRVSKVDTLRAAISYIQFLQGMLVGAELSPAETIRLRNGIVLENTVRIVQSVQKAPYPILPPGYRFVNPPPPPPPQPAAPGPHPSLPVPASGPHPTLPVHPTLPLPLPMLPPQPLSNLPPFTHLRSGYDGQPFQALSIPHLIPSHPNGIIQGNESTALSWLINFQGNVGMPPIDSTERDVIMLGATSQVSTNQNTKENHVTGTARMKSQCRANMVT